MRSGVVLLAAGSGRRMGALIPKQFLAVNGVPLFALALKTFGRLPTVKEIVIVGSSAKFPMFRKWARKFAPKKIIRLTEGGAFRGASVKNGVRAFSTALDVILIHDSARPLVSSAIVSRVEKAANKIGVALAAWPLPDTLKLADALGRVKKTIPRKNLWLAQTPQGFRKDRAVCLLSPSQTATDDVALAERRGWPVAIVQGGADNFKVTFPMDLKLCRLLTN